MAEISKGDQVLVEKIAKLRAIASEARRTAADLRLCLRAEIAMRIRADTYLRYWQPKPSRWSHEELWADKVRLRPGTDHRVWDEMSTNDSYTPVDESSG
jgi:hypothetical protein